MWLIICAVFLWILIAALILSIDEEGEGIGVSLIMICIIGALIHVKIDGKAETVLYYEESKELQAIEGEYFRAQENNYIVKWDNEIRIIPKNKVYTMHSDSAYFTVEIKKTIHNYTKSRQRWLPGKQYNDTTYRENKYYLYRNLNE